MMAWRGTELRLRVSLGPGRSLYFGRQAESGSCREILWVLAFFLLQRLHMFAMVFLLDPLLEYVSRNKVDIRLHYVHQGKNAVLVEFSEKKTCSNSNSRGSYLLHPSVTRESAHSCRGCFFFGFDGEAEGARVAE